MNILPNFLIVGASKSGTSSIYHYLKQHPNIFLSDKQKEGRYFSQMEGNFQGPGDTRINDSIIRNLDDYQLLFDNYNGEKAVGDVSPEYLYYYKKCIPQIKRDLENEVKIVIILRSPIERAFSGYMHFKRDNREKFSFEEGMKMEKERLSENWIWAWQYKNSGLYYSQVKAYFQNFQNLKVVVFEDLKNDTHKILKDLCSFFEIDQDFDFDIKYKYNVSGDPKNKILFKLETSRGLINFVKKVVPPQMVKYVRNNLTGEKQMKKIEMKEETRKKLQVFFKEDILRLQDLIQQDLSHWLL